MFTMNRKIINISLLIILIISFTSGCNKSEQNSTVNLSTINDKSINPISKDTVINILKAEYGENISIKNKDIKLIGDLYFVDVYVEIEEYEDDVNHETHIHRQSLGTQKIDKYTGEIIKD